MVATWLDTNSQCRICSYECEELDVMHLRTWKRDKSGDEVPGNLYAVEFSGKNGLILGNDGLLL
eukprot:scaffold203247_cov14-Tisochrysis_lutea.AAC.1